MIKVRVEIPLHRQSIIIKVFNTSCFCCPAAPPPPPRVALCFLAGRKYPRKKEKKAVRQTAAPSVSIADLKALQKASHAAYVRTSVRPSVRPIIVFRFSRKKKRAVARARKPPTLNPPPPSSTRFVEKSIGQQGLSSRCAWNHRGWSRTQPI